MLIAGDVNGIKQPDGNVNLVYSQSMTEEMRRDAGGGLPGARLNFGSRAGRRAENKAE